MVIDSIANLINGLSNAQKRGHATLRAPYTKLIFSIAEILKREGYVTDIEKDGKDIKKHINLTLKYDQNGSPAINGVKRISHQSKRIYKSVDQIIPVKKGYGTMIISTPKGLLTDKQARKENVGGEVLFEIW